MRASDCNWIKNRVSITIVITSSVPEVHALKLTQIGNSVGVILPKEVLARLKVEKGDTVFVTDAPDGVRITPFDPRVEEQMKAAREIMKRRRGVLRELAK
jgi:putative addiction module antidote